MGFWLLAAVFGFCIGAGWYLPFYKPLSDHIPLFAQLRNPTRIFWCTDVALGCLAAVGIDGVLNARANDSRRRLALIFTCLAAAAVIFANLWALAQLNKYADNPRALLAFIVKQTNMAFQTHADAARHMPSLVMRKFDWPTWSQISVAALGIVLLITAALRRRSAGKIVFAGLTTLLALDLFFVSLGQADYSRTSSVLLETPPAARWLQEHTDGRRLALISTGHLVDSQDQLEGCRCMLFSLRNCGGFGGGISQYPRRDKWMELAPQAFNMAYVSGIKYELTDAGDKEPAQKFVLPAFKDDRYTIYEVVPNPPMVFFVHRLIEVSGLDDVIEVFTKTRFRANSVATIERRTASGDAHVFRHGDRGVRHRERAGPLAHQHEYRCARSAS